MDNNITEANQEKSKNILQHQNTVSFNDLNITKQQIRSNSSQNDNNNTVIIEGNNNKSENTRFQQQPILYILHNQDQEYEDSDDEYENGINSQYNKDYQMIYYPKEQEENEDDFYIGREGKDNGIYSRDQHISRKHIEIQYNHNKGDYFLYDISKNGVWVRTYNRLIHNGQIFMMGNFQYQIDQVNVKNQGVIELHLLIFHNDSQFDGQLPEDDDDEDVVRSILYFDDQNQEKLIGRDAKQCNLVQDDIGLSAIHVRIQKYNNILQIIDENSETGLWIKSRQSTKTERKPYKIENNMEVKLAHVKLIKFKLIKRKNQNQQNQNERHCLYCKDALKLMDIKNDKQNIYIPKQLVNNPICQICQITFNVKEQPFYSCFCNNIGFYMCGLCKNPEQQIQNETCNHCQYSGNEMVMIQECFHMYCHLCMKNNFQKKCIEKDCNQYIHDFIDIEYN